MPSGVILVALIVGLVLLYVVLSLARKKRSLKAKGPETIPVLAESDPVARAQADVQRFGWHFVAAAGESGEPGFIYTIGLWHSFHHAEILLVTPSGDPRELAGVVTRIGKQVASGQSFEEGKSYPGLFGDVPGSFRRVQLCWYPFYLGVALAFYDWKSVPCLQLYWPDKQGRFPWEDEFQDSLRLAQPRLDEFDVEKAILPPSIREEFETPEGFDSSPEVSFILFEQPIDPIFLADWRWLIGNDIEPFAITVMGDVFLRDASGGIFWLDTGRAELEQVAPSDAIFRQMLPSHGPRWLHAVVLGHFRELGHQLAAGAVYSWRQPLFLGGAESAENIDFVSALVHLSFLGRVADAARNPK